MNDKVVPLHRDIVGEEEREKLESFGGHSAGRGRITRWAWDEDAGGHVLFMLYRGGETERLAVQVRRDPESGDFRARNVDGAVIGEGPLDYVLARMDAYLAALHGESGA
jgi:hypothetical protein